MFSYGQRSECADLLNSYGIFNCKIPACKQQFLFLPKATANRELARSRRLKNFLKCGCIDSVCVMNDTIATFLLRTCRTQRIFSRSITAWKSITWMASDGQYFRRSYAQCSWMCRPCPRLLLSARWSTAAGWFPPVPPGGSDASGMLLRKVRIRHICPGQPQRHPSH